MAIDRGDAGRLELVVELHLLLGHVEQPAHVGVVDAGRRGGVHHGDVPEVLGGVDHGVAAGDGLPRRSPASRASTTTAARLVAAVRWWPRRAPAPR